MRWPWQPAPGMVRVNQRRLIELQRNALRVADLEAESRLMAQHTARVRAQARAMELLNERRSVSSDERAVEGVVLGDLPLTAAGELHEAAFAALVDAQVWEHRDGLRRSWQDAR